MSDKGGATFDFSVMQKMEEEFAKQEKEQEVETLKELQEQQELASEVMQKLYKKISTELEGVKFILNPISVEVWDEGEGNRDDVKVRSTMVFKSLISPKLEREQFNQLPAGLKYKLFLFLLQDFFSTAGKVTLTE